MIITRSDRSNIALWWWTIDRYLLTGFFILILIGIFLVMASSQHLTQSLNLSSHHRLRQGLPLAVQRQPSSLALLAHHAH